MQVPIFSRYRWVMLTAACLAIMSCYMDMIAYAPILDDVAKGLRIDIGLATNLMMGFILTDAFVLMWGGAICDKYGITAALVLGLVCATLPATFMPLIGSGYGTVLAARLIQGASTGFIFAVVGPILALWFPAREQGIAGGLMIGSISMGSALGVLASPAIFTSTGSWQATIAIISLPGWVALVFALAATRKAPNPEVADAATKGMEAGTGTVGSLTFVKSLALPQTWVATLLMICNAWGLYCLYNLVPPYLAAPAPMGVGLGSVTAGALSVALTLIGLFAMIVGGVFFDSIFKGNSKPAIAVGFALTGLFTYFILSPAVCGSMPLLIICLMVAGWGIPFMNPSVSAFVVMNYPPMILGRIIGWIFGIGTFGGALGLYFGGISIGATRSFKPAITMISLAALAGLALSFFLKPRNDTGRFEN